MPVLVALLILAVLALALWHRRRQKRRALLSTPLSEDERAIIADQVPLTRKLPTALRPAFEGKIRLFLHQIDFIGCDGLTVTEEMRLSIAAQACLLVANTDAWYRSLRTVLIYPGAFRSMQTDHSGYVVTERESVRLGESWAQGPVVLSWAHSARGAADAEDGQNVVFHEFAHQIDALSGDTDGAPLLDPHHEFSEWEQAIVDAFDIHQRRIESGLPTLLDAYGADSYEEFFAVAVEAFFETPVALRDEEPEIYAQLKKLFRLDPAAWT